MGQRRDEILEIARTLFAEGGVRNTSMRDLANASGVLPSSLYSHFASKDDLVDEIMRDYCTYLTTECRRAQVEVVDPVDRLRALILVAMSLLERFPSELAIHQKDSAYLMTLPKFSYLSDMREAVRDSWLSAITEAMAAGRIRDDLPPVVLYRWMRDAVFLTFIWFDAADGITAEGLGTGAANLFLDGLVASSPSASR